MGKTQKQFNRLSTEVIIQKTIFASVMNNGFWHRWIAHGLDEDFIASNRAKMTTLEAWTEKLSNKALEHIKIAKGFNYSGDLLQAEHHFRKAGIYYNLAQWVYPNPVGARVDWYKLCLQQFKIADSLLEDDISYPTITFEGKKYSGRVRKPKGESAGVVIIVPPIDSTKEELFTYEQDFAKEGFVVISFDGTGQGETLILNGHKGKKGSWMKLVGAVIDFASSMFPNLSINLFGTSSGGSWATEGSRHPLVAKTVVVSPAPSDDVKVALPDYFQERLFNIMEDLNEVCLPSLDDVKEIDNVLMFHGGKDVMVRGEDLLELFSRFSPEKRFITYEEEGHCCNFKLPEIRQRASKWFKGMDINEI
jgi:dienelactone hydrolase